MENDMEDKPFEIMNRGNPLTSDDVKIELNRFIENVKDADTGEILINTLDQKYSIKIDRSEKRSVEKHHYDRKMVVTVFDNRRRDIQRLAFNMDSVTSIMCGYTYEPVSNGAENGFR